LERLDDMLARKRVLADRYAAAFDDFERANFLTEPADTRSNYWLNAIVLEPGAGSSRDAVLDALNNEGIMARPVWTLMHRLPMYASAPRADLSTAEDLEARVINLPSSPRLAD
jgi:perosamine synthetase